MPSREGCCLLMVFAVAFFIDLFECWVFQAWGWGESPDSLFTHLYVYFRFFVCHFLKPYNRACAGCHFA